MHIQSEHENENQIVDDMLGSHGADGARGGGDVRPRPQ